MRERFASDCVIHHSVHRFLHFLENRPKSRARAQDFATEDFLTFSARANLSLESAHPPLRLVLGGDAVERVTNKLAAVRQDLEDWREVSLETDFDETTD
jgi:hypothetical protein